MVHPYFDNKGEPLSWPIGVDSLDKLTKALAECGVPQRDWTPEEPIDQNAEIYHWAFRVKINDRDGLHNGYKNLLRIASGALYAQFSFVGGRIVWRIRPEVVESRQAGLKTVQFYCRFWKEAIE